MTHPLELELEDILLPIIDEYNLLNVLDDEGNEKDVDWPKFWKDQKQIGNYLIKKLPETNDGFIYIYVSVSVLKSNSNILQEVIKRIEDFKFEIYKKERNTGSFTKYVEIKIRIPRDRKFFTYENKSSESVKFPYPNTNEDIEDVLVFIFDENKIIDHRSDKLIWFEENNYNHKGTYFIDYGQDLKEKEDYIDLTLRFKSRQKRIVNEIIKRLESFEFLKVVYSEQVSHFPKYIEYGIHFNRKLKQDKINDSLVLTFEKWSNEYKKSIDCKNPKGFSQIAHCAARKKRQRREKTKSKPVK
jgi:hypothetical protein